MFVRFLSSIRNRIHRNPYGPDWGHARNPEQAARDLAEVDRRLVFFRDEIESFFKDLGNNARAHHVHQ